MILEGKPTADRILEKVKAEIAERGIEPCLAVVMVGDDPASKIYVGLKEKACARSGIRSIVNKMPADISQDELDLLVAELNKDASVNAVLVQLPLPAGLDPDEVLSHIDPIKDVDGITSENLGKLVRKEEGIVPCTPQGIMELIRSTGIAISGKHAVVIGRSNIVGRPIAQMLLNSDATVTVCHSKTKNLGVYTRQADILVSAVGKPGLIRGDMIKKGAVVIDVGTTKVDDKLKGDVVFEEAKNMAGWITPVPKGVGPMTIAMLMKNTLECYRLQRKN